MPEGTNDAGELRAATADAFRAVRRMRDGLGGIGILATLGERISALLGEFAWEIGMIDPAEMPVSVPAGARLDHVGIVVADLAAAALLYGDLLGGTLVSGGIHRGLGVRSMHLTFPGGGKIELLQPVVPGPIADFLEKRGGGMHHLTFFTPDLLATLDELGRHDLTVVDVALDAPEWQEAYLGRKSTQGCVIQLVQSEELTPVDGVTVDSVLADEWEWIDHRARRISNIASPTKRGL